jgi:hypothetical protein
VQNSLGRQWLAVYPDSSLKATMDYYIAPAAQSPEVNAALAAITPSTLNPESLTVIDPAMGSGHILVEAYDLLKAIYLERGYSLRDIPVLILKNNLYGLDIDDRAAQLAMFALMMKARADDRKIFSRELSLNLLHLHSSADMDAEMLGLNCARAWRLDYDADEQSALQSILRELLAVFAQAETVGSLIQIPTSLREYLPTFERAVARLEVVQGDYLQEQTRLALIPLVQQAMILARRYDVVVANPPYMGGKGMNEELKAFAKKYFPDSKSDMFAMFMERGFELAKPTGFNAQVTMQSWMFLSSYQAMRDKILENKTIQTLTQVGYNSFPDLNSKVVQVSMFVIRNNSCANYIGTYINLNLASQSADKNKIFLERTKDLVHDACQKNFKKISGSPVAYWVSDKVRDKFSQFAALSNLCETRKGMATGLNAEFVRNWAEVSISNIGFGKSRDEAKELQLKWFPYANGGEFRKWYGNYHDVVNWENDGDKLQTELHENGQRIRAVNLNLDFIFEDGLSWTSITSSYFSIRYLPKGFWLFPISRGRH